MQPKHDQRLILFTLLVFCFVTLSVSEKPPTSEKKYLPKEIKKLKFGTPKTEVLSTRKNAELSKDNEYNFREVYSEQVDTGGIDFIVYYFDNEGDQPLYEVIINYDTEADRDKVVKKLLGAPNYKEKEWKFDIGGPYPLHAWTYKNKLIFAMPIKGTEWEEGI